MKVLDLKLYVVDLPFRFSFNHSLAKRSYSQNLIVRARIENENGISTGYGEGIPRNYVTGETIEESIIRLQELYFPLFAGKEFSDIGELSFSIIDHFFTLDLDKQASGASWCALELALLDAASKAGGVPLSHLLTPEAVDLPTSITYGATASLTGKTKLMALLLFFKLYGFSTVKLKLDGNIDESIDRIRLARSVLGKDATIRVDANCAWSLAQTIEFSKKAESWNIASIEQPLPPSRASELAKLASLIPQPIVLDESLCTIEQAKYFAQRGINVHFNIRISKVGGLLTAATIKNIADSAGIQCHLGAQVGESGILTVAGRIFALSKGPFINYEGAANSFLLKQDITEENMTFSFGGIGKLPNGIKKPGLGITVNEKDLKDLAVASKINSSNTSLPYVTAYTTTQNANAKVGIR